MAQYTRQRTLTDCRLIQKFLATHPPIMTIWLRNDTGGWTRVHACVHVTMFDFDACKTYAEVEAIMAAKHDWED